MTHWLTLLVGNQEHKSGGSSHKDESKNPDIVSKLAEVGDPTPGGSGTVVDFVDYPIFVRMFTHLWCLFTKLVHSEDIRSAHIL